MWRSWVDRINVTAKNEQEDEPVPQSSQYSPEELKRREQLEIQLQDVWRQCEDLLSSEQERSDMFMLNFLPKFCELYGDTKEPLRLPPLINERAFMGLLSRHLLTGIRKIPEQKTKAESSEALMNNLRSKWHLYNVLKAMRIVSCGPVVFLNMMQQQRLPSVMTKIFRSFIDLPAVYYEQDTPTEGDNDMASLDDIGSMVAKILERFVGNPSILRRLILDDTFFTIMRLISTKPAHWDNAHGQYGTHEEPVYMLWKHKTIAILKSIDSDPEMIQFIHSRRYIGMLVQTWKDGLNKSRLHIRDYIDITLDLDLIIHLLKASMDTGVTGLFDELQQVDVYKTLLSFLLAPPFDEQHTYYKIQLVNELVDLTFVGKGVGSPSITDGLPYQHDDFVYPKHDESKGPIVRNLAAVQTLQSGLLYPMSSNNSKQSTSPQLQAALFFAIRDIIQRNPINFFLVERTNVLPLLIETMENYSPDVQDAIMGLLDFVMLDLNFVPLKELAVLSLHLQSTNSNGKLVGLICKCLTGQLQKSPKLVVVARESGLINMMSLMLSNVNEYLNEEASANSESTNDGSSFIQNILADFDTVVKCVVEMVKDQTNMAIFRKLYNGNIFDLLHYRQTRLGALELFEALSRHNTDLSPDQPESSTTPSTNNVSYAFSRVMEAVQGIPRTDLLFRLEILKTIKRIFQMYPFTRDVFRLSGGYVSLVSMIVSLENAFTDSSDFGGGDMDDGQMDPDALKQALTQVLELILIVLMESLRHNDTNQQYLTKVVGYEALGNALELTGALTQDGIAATFFGLLFAFMVQDETMRGLFTNEHANVLVDTGALDHPSLLQHIDYALNDSMVDVHNPDMALTILRLQQTITWDDELGHAVLVALYALARGNRQNQIKLNRCGLVLKAVERIYPRGANDAHPASQNQMVHQETDKSRNILVQIVKKLITMGVGDKELRYLFQSFGTDGYLTDLEDPAIDGLLDLILHGTSRSRWPNFIQLDVSSDSNKRSRPTASLEIPRLANFPPPSSGYTVTMWLHIEQWNKVSNMTVWSLWDGQRVVFHVYIDAATGYLHIHSGTSKVDCKFDSFEFKSGYWYHVGLVHGKSRLGASLSTVTLFINGVWMEQARCTYVAPGLQGHLKCMIGGNLDDEPAQNHRLIWDLGPTYIMADTLDGDLMNLYFHLGARYKSLFQDSLRQFQTYDASTALFLNLRGITKRRNMNKSTLASVMRGATAHSSLPENKILLALIAGNTLAYGNQTGLTLTGLSQEHLQRIQTDDTTKHMLLNSAIPKIDHAIDETAFTAFLVGNPGVAYPFGLDESIWKIGGCAIGLNFVQRSETASMLFRSAKFLVEIIQYSWRNSDDMERCHGYEIMANILKQKRDIITVDLLELLLQFIGKKNGQPEESTINNPYAYRSIILNFEIWKKTSISVQKAHLEQFILFMETSNQHAFNLKRLLKVHIVKKMLLAFRMNIYAKELIPNVVSALKAVTKSSWTTESIRAVATFLASTAPNGAGKIKVYPTVKRSRLPRSNSLSISTTKPTDRSSDASIITDSKTYSQTTDTSTKTTHMCNIVMEMLHDILCSPGNQDYVHKFSLTITNKWPLLFFAPETDPYTVVLASRILIRIFYVEGPDYMNKFGVSSEGFLIMGRLLPHFWNLTQLYETLLVLLMGLDVSEYPLFTSFDIAHIQTFIAEASPPSKFITAQALPLLMNLCREGSRCQRNKDPEPGTTSMNKVQYNLVLLLNDLYKTRADFRDACNRQEVLDDLVEILFQTLGKGGPGEDLLSVDEEIQLKEDSTNFDDFCTTPSSTTTSTYSPIDGTMMVFTNDHSNNSNNSNVNLDTTSVIKRGGTSTLVTKTSPHLNKKSGAMLTRLRSASWSQHVTPTRDSTPLAANPALEVLLQFLVDICTTSVIDPSDKNLTVLNMVMNSYPPSTLEAQMKFESHLLTYISQNLKSTLQFDAKLLSNNVVVVNVSKFCQFAADAVLQGRFIDGAEQTYDLLATILETLYSMDTGGGGGLVGRRGISDQTASTLYRAFNRMVLLKISDLEQGGMESDQIVAFLNYCIHHQKIILSGRNTDQEFLRCFCYHLYQFLSSSDDTIKKDALNVWKLLLLQKPDAVSNGLKMYTGEEELLEGFSKMLEMDQDSFFVWVDSRRVDLNMLFKEHVHVSWESVITQENKYSRETWKNHQARRLTKLKKIQKRQLHESEIFAEYTAKTAIWSKSIQEVEISRFTKALQDNDGHENFIRSEWTRINNDLTRERAIWGPQIGSTTTATVSKWALDFTEGRYRMRKKIRCISDGPGSVYLPKHTSSSPPSSASPTTIKSQDASVDVESPRGQNSDSDNADVMINKTISEVDEELTSDPAEQKNEEESGQVQASSNDSEIQQMDTDNDDDLSYEEDKNQKVLRLLDPGDMVLDVYNVSQIEGLDAREGLLLICKHHIYLVDNFFQRADGEVVEIWDVPKQERDEYLLLLTQAAGMETEHPMGATGDLHTCRKWSTGDLREVFKRRFLFRDVALELFFADGQNALITVERSDRDDLFTKLANRVTTANDNVTGSIFGAIDKESSSLGSAFKFTSIFGTSTLHDLTNKWERREITNFQYLIYINAIAGRSYNDLTQYPVFPWILADYTSSKLDLSDPKTFRDLSKPMGAQTPERRVEFQDRYRQWGEINDPAPAFHYGTHYSSAMIVCSFLIRLEPFTQHYLKLQGGSFDHADRLFDSVGKAWDSASEKNMGDVRELIPEFFCLPEFLDNVNKFNFGTKQGTGETIDSVTLPPWASGDSKIFIQRHREALESDYVSENLHHWIDLIFGYKQQGKAAIDSLNVFHHVSYEGAVDLDAITDIVEKTATIGIINNFGQTPRQLFKKPHPARSAPIKDPLALGFYPFRPYLQMLMQSVYPLRDIRCEIGDIGVYNDRLGVAACQQSLMIPDGQHYIEWGYSDNSLRLYSTDSKKLINIFENFHDGFISTAYFPDTRTLVTGGTDSIVSIWKTEHGKQISFDLQETLRGHTGVVTSVSASRSYSIIVTGSQDKTAIIWDLNRLKYVRSLPGHETGVHLTRVNDATGDIVTCSGNMLRIWSINGDLYLTKPVCPSSEKVLSCAIYDPKPNEWSSSDLIVTGHQKGVVKFWEKDIKLNEKTGEYQWSLNQIYQLQHTNRMDSTFDTSDVVSLYISPKRTLLTGNRHGQVYSFVLPDTSDTLHLLKEDRCKECTQCRKSFSVLERKSYCRGCGGIYCLSCISNAPTTVPDKSARFCKNCQSSLL